MKFKLTQTEIFWIQFAGFYCRVTATLGIKEIINKYFSGSYLSVSSHGPRNQNTISEVVIHLKNATAKKNSIVIKKEQIGFTVLIFGSPHFYYPILANLLQRVFMVLFYNNGGIVFHASAVESQGKAHVFVGESGKGKTTIARLSNDLYGLRILADNQVFIRKQAEEYYLFPFPITQYHKDGENSCLPIASFYILHQAESFAVTSLSFIESTHALEREIQILSAEDSGLELTKCPPLVRRSVFDFARTVVIKRLYFLPTKGIWEAINISS